MADTVQLADEFAAPASTAAPADEGVDLAQEFSGPNSTERMSIINDSVAKARQFEKADKPTQAKLIQAWFPQQITSQQRLNDLTGGYFQENYQPVSSEMSQNAGEQWETINKPLVNAPRMADGPDIAPNAVIMVNPKTLTGIYNGLAPIVSSLSSPLNLATMGSWGALTKLASEVGPAAQAAKVGLAGIKAYFAGEMAKGAGGAAGAASVEPNAENITGVLAQSALSLMAARGTLSDVPKTEIPEEINHANSQSSPVEEVRGQPETPPADSQVATGKPSGPEAPAGAGEAQAEVKPLPNDAVFTVMEMGGKRAVQIDAPGEGDRPKVSGSPEDLAAAGYEVPDVSALPEGKTVAADIPKPDVAEEFTPPTPGTDEHVAATESAQPPPAGETPMDGSEPPNYGIAARVSEERAKAGGIEGVEPGEGISAEESVAHGRDLLESGRDPQAAVAEFTKDGRISADSMALVRAHGETLAKAAFDALDEHGADSEQYKTAAKADSDWVKTIKPMQTEWHKIGQAQQGETEVDTGNFHALARAHAEATGSDFSDKQAEQAKDIASGVRKATNEAKTATQKVLDAIKEEPKPEAKARKGRVSQFITDQAAAARERIKARLTEGRVSSGLDPQELADHAIVGAEYIAKGVEKFAEWSKKMADEFGERIVPHLKGIFDAAKAKVEEFSDQKRAEDLEKRKASLQTQINKLREKVETGDISPAPKKSNRPSEKPIETLEQERDGLREELTRMRDSAAKIKELQESIAGKERKIAEGDLSTKPNAANRPSPPEIEKLKQDRDDLNKQLAEARKEAAKPTDAERIQKQVDSINERIAEKKEQLASGDIAPEKRPINRPHPNQEVETALQELDRVNRDLADARKGGSSEPDKGSVQDIWQRAKDYIQSGETDYDEIRHKIATDLGIPVEEVTKKLTEPKSARLVTDEMYAKLAARRRLVQNAQDWLKNQQTPGWLRFARAVPNVFFRAKVFGHGTVGMVTHAGLNFFHPEAWATYFPNFIKQFKLLGWHDQGAYHERMMQDLVRDPNYIKARRAGLANDPAKYTDDYQKTWVGSWLEKMGLSGNRGFDALKLFRQARFNQIWDGLPKTMQGPEMAKVIADGINHATGVVRMPFREWANWAFFAPKLEGSRWAWMVGDPAKAAKTLGNWSEASAADKQFAIKQVKEKATIAGVYLSLLAANQGLLKATGSNQQVNFTDPRKSDFLSFKAGGYKFGIVGPMLGIVRLFANLVHASMGTRKGAEALDSRAAEMGKIGEEYLRGKLSPFAGTATDFATQADYAKRPLPFSSDKVPANIRKEGLGKYTWGEYLTEQGAPIPISESIKEIWDKQGIDESTQAHYIKAILSGLVMGSTGARASKDFSVKPTQSLPPPAPR